MDISLENFGERQSRVSVLAGKIVSVAGRQDITGVVVDEPRIPALFPRSTLLRFVFVFVYIL